MGKSRNITEELAQSEIHGGENLKQSTLEFDYERYRSEMDEYDVSEQEAKEFLEALFYIIHTIVDISMGLDITQIMEFEHAEKDGQDSGNSIQLDTQSILEQHKSIFNDAVNDNVEEV